VVKMIAIEMGSRCDKFKLGVMVASRAVPLIRRSFYSCISISISDGVSLYMDEAPQSPSNTTSLRDILA
jgi:hypothetical protein